MWPFPRGQKQELGELSDQLHGLTLRVKHLEETLLALEDKHERLRGRFYASKGPDSPPENESKAAILRRMGYMR